MKALPRAKAVTINKPTKEIRFVFRNLIFAVAVLGWPARYHHGIPQSCHHGRALTVTSFAVCTVHFSALLQTLRKHQVYGQVMIYQSFVISLRGVNICVWPKSLCCCCIPSLIFDITGVPRTLRAGVAASDYPSRIGLPFSSPTSSLLFPFLRRRFLYFFCAYPSLKQYPGWKRFRTKTATITIAPSNPMKRC